MNDEKLFQAMMRFMDYEAYFMKMWFDECDTNDCTKRIYQAQYNQLVNMKQRMTPEFLMQFLDKEKFDMPEANECIYITDRTPHNPRHEISAP